MSRQGRKLKIVGPRVLERSSGRRLRLAARCVALGLAVVCVLQWLPWDWTPLLPTALSPWVAACSLLATRTLSVAVLLGLPVLVLAILRRRWFCRYACPTGLLVECAGWVRRSGAPPATRVPHVGHWVAVVTLAGAALGYPLLLWLDPLTLFTSFVGGCTGTTDRAARWLMAGLPLVLLLSLFWPGLWCLRLCPLGATQELLTLPKRWLRHRRDRATTAAAPHHGAWRLTRRVVLASGLGAGWAALVLKHRGSPAPRPLRPPGSAAEPRFTGLCLRCGNCARACPSKIIVPETAGQGLAGFLAPVVRFQNGYCLEDCRRCTQVCPSGAIRPLSLEEKRRAAIGLARVDMDVCLLGDEKECAICRNHCPYDAIKIVFSEADYVTTPVVDAAKCPGCGACEVACPTSPVKAIRVVPSIDFPAAPSRVVARVKD